MTVDELLWRARAALAMPTLYWLGKGGRKSPAKTPAGGDFVDWRDHLDDPKVAAFVERALAAGLEPADVPRMPACDCSGFVWWVLNEARANRDTLWIHKDSATEQQRFERFDPKVALRAKPGALLVYPDGATDVHGEPVPQGHVGVVTEVDAAGMPLRVIHCSASNFLQPPAPGQPRNAIRETGPEAFEGYADTRAVWFKAVPR